MGSSEQYIVGSIVNICHRLDQKGFGANHDGNVSVRHGEKIFATPTSVSKADVTPEMIICLDLSGNKIGGHGKPFSEIGLHLAAYRSRQDISAVVHAHPPYATACGLAGIPLDRPALPEAVVSIGDVIPVAPFAMPGDAKNDEIVSEMLSIINVFMMPGNGLLSVGTDVLQAYLRLELVEHLAKIECIVRQLGKSSHELSDADVEGLLLKRAAAGLAPTMHTLNKAKANVAGPPSDIHSIIEEEVKKALSTYKSL